MSNRLCFEGKQIFGNNDFPEEVYHEMVRQGCINNINEDSFYFKATDPDGLLTAIEKSVLKDINEWAKIDNDLLVNQEDKSKFIIGEINSNTLKHQLYLQSKYLINDKKFFIVYNFVLAVSKKCFYDCDTEKLAFKKGKKYIMIKWS